MIVDPVYRGVEQLLSKYGAGGYLTPTEFSNYARIAQNQKLGDDLFNDIDSLDKNAKLSNFKVVTNETVNEGVLIKPLDYRNFESAKGIDFSSGVGIASPFEQLTNSEFNFRLGSELDKPTKSYPALTERDTYLEVAPRTVNFVELTYVKNPPEPVWGYSIINGRRVYDENGASSGGVDSVDFVFGEDDIPDLVYRIGVLLGIEIMDNETTKNLQVEKQIENNG